MDPANPPPSYKKLHLILLPPAESASSDVLAEKYNPPRYQLLWDISRPKCGTEHVYNCMLNHAINNR